MAEAVLAGKQIKELSLPRAPGALAAFQAIIAWLAEDFFVSNRPADGRYRHRQHYQPYKLKSYTHTIVRSQEHTESLLLYYITDRQQFSGSGVEKRQKLLETIASAARAGVDFIQLRERDLSARDLERLAEQALSTIRGNTPEPSRAQAMTRLLVNSRLDVALAVGADGVHLRSTDINAGEVRAIASKVLANHPALPSSFVISVACHSASDVRHAEAHGADLALFAPVFGKAEGSIDMHGISGLRKVCRDRRSSRPPIPILALGGITAANALASMQAGAAGVAGIRLFQQGDLLHTVAQLREVERKVAML